MRKPCRLIRISIFRLFWAFDYSRESKELLAIYWEFRLFIGFVFFSNDETNIYFNASNANNELERLFNVKCSFPIQIYFKCQKLTQIQIYYQFQNCSVPIFQNYKNQDLDSLNCFSFSNQTKENMMDGCYFEMCQTLLGKKIIEPWKMEIYWSSGLMN